MSVAISVMTPELRIELPGILEPALTAAMYRGLRKFFWESEAWKYTYDNGLDYTISERGLPPPTVGTDIPAKTVVKRVDTVKFSSTGENWEQIIPFKTRDRLDREDADWYTAEGTAPLAWTYDNAAPIVYPIASATVDTALLIRSVIAPLYTAQDDTLPDLLYYEFEDFIKAGILADLMKMPGKDWSNPQMSAYYKGQYDAGVKKAKSRAEADFGQPKGTMAYGGL